MDAQLPVPADPRRYPDDMQARPNDGGGTTLGLANGDDLDEVPDSHQDLLTDSIRQAFRDPVSCFSAIAKQTQIPSLDHYLGRFVADGNWLLLLADTYMMDRETIAGFQWFHADQCPCMFGLSTADCDDDRFASLYDHISMVHWDSIGFAGGILPFAKHITVEAYGATSSNAVFPSDSTVVFGNSSCGDMMVCNNSGDAGYLSHETGASYVVGSFPEMLDWIFGELLENRMPEFDYSRCQ